MNVLQPWRVLRSRPIFADAPHISITADDIELPSGEVVENYYQIGSSPSCAIVASTSDDKLIMLRQYKHGARKVCLTFPGGRREAGETLLETARRELREETGYEAQDWRSLGCFPIHANQHVGIVELFRAEGAVAVAEPAANDLEDMEITLVSAAEASEALKNGDIALLGDAAALALTLSERR